MSELKPCPFCGELPEVECQGTFFDIQCCVSLSLQKCDYLTIKERETFDGENFFYSDEAEEKVRQIAEKIWNTRPIEDALRAEIDQLKALVTDLQQQLLHKNLPTV